MFSDLLSKVIDKVTDSEAAFCHFITANDAGKTGAHQCGYYIPKCASKILFDKPGVKGVNKDKYVTIIWQDEFKTSSRFVYYGVETRNEYRITRFGRNFPFLNDTNVGNLLVLIKKDENYWGYVLSNDEDIDNFFAFFNISPDDTNSIIGKTSLPKDKLAVKFAEIVSNYDSFPKTEIMAQISRECYNEVNNVTDVRIINDPDTHLLHWINAEYSLFRCFEEKIYADTIKVPFENCQALIDFSNSILNRRKSRAGKSLEHHLAVVFSKAGLKFEEQVITEDNKKPDFIFPDGKAYHNSSFPSDKLVFLGAKTTCKDRWRQVLNEADKIGTKYLFTLQQGISKNQLKEMEDAQLKLVVPAQYKNSFDSSYQNKIESLSSFIDIVRKKQN